MYILAYLAAGILGGLVTGLTGANAMSVIMSILLLAGLQVHDVIGLCLGVQIFTMSITLIPLLQQTSLAWQLVPVICIPAVFTAYGGARMALQIPTLFLEILVIVLLFIVGVLLLRAKPLRSDADEGAGTPHPARRDLVKIGLTGALSGFMAGMVGGGGNIIVANGLNRILGITFRRAVTLSLCLGIAAAVLGVIPYLHAGRVDPVAALWILVPALAVAWLSSHWSRHVPANRIRQIQGVYLIGVSALLAVHAIL